MHFVDFLSKLQGLEQPRITNVRKSHLILSANRNLYCVSDESLAYIQSSRPGQAPVLLCITSLVGFCYWRR